MAESLEPLEVVERYARRKALPGNLYDPLSPNVYMARQERERALIRWINWAGLAPLRTRKLLEVGCGTGGNLTELMRLGFLPQNLFGNELLAERIESARTKLPRCVGLVAGDASQLDYPSGEFDVVFQSTVFTSLLDPWFQARLAARMWTGVKPGGGCIVV